MKRRWLLGFAALGALTAGSAVPPALAAPTEISLVGWGGPEEKVIIQEVIRRFEAKNPDLKVKYTQIPGVGFEYLNKVRLLIVAGMAPDVFYVPDGAFAEMASRNTLLNLDAYVAKSKVVKVADMWPSAVDRYRWDGVRSQRGALYCLPKDIGPNVMFYNKDVLKARGVKAPDPKTPMTWDTAIATWKQLSWNEGRSQHYGISGYPYEAAVWSSGGEIVSEDKRSWVLNSPQGIAGVQWAADLGLVHKVAPDGSKTAGGSGSSSPGQLFESQLAAMHIDGRWMVPRFRKLGFDWDVAPLPVPKKGMKSITWSGSVGFGISSSTKRASESFRLVEYMAGPEGQTEMTKSGLQVPNQRWLADTDVYMQRGQKPAHPEVFLASAATSRPGPWTDTPNTFWHDVYWTFIGKIWRGERKAKDILPELSPLINETLRENNPDGRK